MAALPDAAVLCAEAAADPVAFRVRADLDAAAAAMADACPEILLEVLNLPTGSIPGVTAGGGGGGLTLGGGGGPGIDNKAMIDALQAALTNVQIAAGAVVEAQSDVNDALGVVRRLTLQADVKARLMTAMEEGDEAALEDEVKKIEALPVYTQQIRDAIEAYTTAAGNLETAEVMLQTAVTELKGTLGYDALGTAVTDAVNAIPTRFGTDRTAWGNTLTNLTNQLNGVNIQTIKDTFATLKLTYDTDNNGLTRADIERVLEANTPGGSGDSRSLQSLTTQLQQEQSKQRPNQTKINQLNAAIAARQALDTFDRDNPTLQAIYDKERLEGLISVYDGAVGKLGGADDDIAALDANLDLDLTKEGIQNIGYYRQKVEDAIALVDAAWMNPDAEQAKKNLEEALLKLDQAINGTIKLDEDGEPILGEDGKPQRNDDGLKSRIEQANELINDEDVQAAAETDEEVEKLLNGTVDEKGNEVAGLTDAVGEADDPDTKGSEATGANEVVEDAEQTIGDGEQAITDYERAKGELEALAEELVEEGKLEDKREDQTQTTGPADDGAARSSATASSEPSDDANSGGSDASSGGGDTSSGGDTSTGGGAPSTDGSRA